MSEVEPEPRRFGRLALRCWLIATGLFVLSFVIGVIASVIGPGDDSVQTWAPIIFPAVISLVSAPLLVAALLLTIRSFITEGATLKTVVVHVLTLLSLLPAGFIFFHAVKLLTGNG